jgi:zinc protease
VFVSTTLENGLAVSILGDPAYPIVATQVWYHVGSANEEPDTRGFAHLFEHLMFGGTSRHPARSYWDLHERHGGDNNAYTSFDETVYVSEIAPDGFEEVARLEADRMTELVLDQQNLDNEKRIVTEELRLWTENNPQSRLFVAALGQLLGDHPYATSPAGTKEDIERATLELAAEFYERFYRPRNAHVVVVGPVDAERALEVVRRAFGGLPAGGETPADVPRLDEWEFPAEVALREDLPPVEITLLGFPLPAADSSDYWTLRVLCTALADGAWDPVEDALAGRREKALFAGAEWFHARRGGGLVLFSVNLPYRRRATAFRHLEETRRELAAFDWLDESRLAAAKRSLAKTELERVYWAAERADGIGRAAWWHGDPRLAFEATERIEAVTLDEARRAFERWVAEAAPVRVHVRAERVPLWLRATSWLYPIFR